MGAVAVFAGFTATMAIAQPSDYRVYFTFNRNVEVPGVTLPAGKYIFHVMDLSKQVVQVLSADGLKAHAMFIAISAERTEPSDKPEIRFMETPAGTPPAIQTWWYPGRQIGWEFIYPKTQARQLAQRTTQPVLTTKAETTKAEEAEGTPLARLSPKGETEVTAESKPAAGPPTGTPEYGEVAAPPSETAAAPAAPESTVARAEAPRRLPKTGTVLPLIGLIGLGTIGAAAGLRLSCRGRV